MINFKKCYNIKIIGLVVYLIFYTAGFVNAIDLSCSSCLRVPLLFQKSRSETKKQDEIDYDGLKRELKEAFDPQKDSEKVKELVGSNKFERIEGEKFRLKPFEAICITYDIGGSNEGQGKILASELKNYADYFFARLTHAIKYKIARVDPKLFHITIADLIDSSNPLYKDVNDKIENSVRVFMESLPDKFKESIKAEVVGIDMFTPGIIKFKIKVHDEKFFIRFRQAIKEAIRKDPYLADKYIEKFSPETYGQHITLGYLMEPLEAGEIEELVNAMQSVSALEENHISFNLSVGELTKWNENGLIFLSGPRKNIETLPYRKDIFNNL